MTADPIGGVWNYTMELCAGLATERVRVALATLGAMPSRAQLDQLAALPNVSLFPSVHRLEWMPDPWEDLRRAGEWLLTLEKALRPDLVHLNHLMHADLPWNAPVLTVAHSCVLSWWSAVRGTPLPPEWLEYRLRVRHSLQAAHCVVAPTRAILSEIQRHYGPFHRSSVIHNARNARGYSTGPKEHLILAAGRVWDPAKNIEALAAVAPSVNASIHVAGETCSPRGTAIQLPSLHLLGPLDADALGQWYSRAAIYALPARYEPFGLTALEAALSGCALVLGDIPTLREVWGTAARYVHPDDRNGLSDTLNGLLLDDASRTELAGRAMARARRFSPWRFARRYLSLYRGLSGGRRHATAHEPAHRTRAAAP